MSKKDTPLVGMEGILSRLTEIASVPPAKVREILGAQIDALALCANDACLESFQIIKSPDSTPEQKVSALKLMSSLGFFADSISRQRIALQKEISALPVGGNDRPLIAASGELAHDEWEKKYGEGPQLLPKSAAQA